MSTNNDPSPQKTKLKVRDPSVPTEKTQKSSKARGQSNSGRTSKRKATEKKDPWERAAKVLLGAGIVSAPWAFGSVSALAQAVWCVVILACLVIWLIQCFRQKQVGRFHSSLVLVLLFLGIGLVQLFSLPSFVSQSTATHQNVIRSNIATAVEDNHADTAKTLMAQKQIALNVPAAYYQLSYFLLIGVTVFLGSRFFSRRQDLLALATVAGINGAVISVFGAFQKVVDTQSVFGLNLKFGGMPFGPFVNRNNAAGYLLICLACSFAILVYSFSNLKAADESRKSGLENDGALNSFMRELRIILANLNVSRISMLAMCGLIVAGVALSLSRGGMIAMSIAFVVLMLMLFRYKKNRALILLLFFFLPAGIGTLVWTGMQSSVSDRLHTLGEGNVLTDSERSKLWNDSIHAVSDYPIMGSGAGSYPYVYKEYQTYPDRVWFFHAENFFLEILITMGMVGLGIGLIFLAILIKTAIGLPKTKDNSKKANPKSTAIGVLLFFGIASQVVSNFFDFGLLIPANGLLFALLIGGSMGVASAGISKEKRRAPIRFALLPSWIHYPLLLIFGVSISWAGYSLLQIHRAETANYGARSNSPEELTLADIKGSISKLETVVHERPNLESHQYLAQLYVLNLHHEFTDYEFAKIKEASEITRQQVFEGVSLRLLNFQIAALGQENRQRELERLAKLVFVSSNVEAATQHYLKALEICPLNAHAIVGLAELAFFNGKEVGPYLAAFENLNVQNAAWHQRMGDVAVAHNLKDAGFRYWRKSIELDKNNYKIVVPTAILFFEFEKICYELIPADASILDEIAEEYFAAEKDVEQRELIYTRINELLSKETHSDISKNYLLGKARMKIGLVIEAISSYETATAMAPLKYQWKADLAKLYFDVGEVEKARLEIKKCRDAERDNEEYKRLEKLFNE